MTLPPLRRLHELARGLERKVRILYLIAKHPRTPWYAKALAAAIVAYALSPIDLIPDFIPVLGQLDDLAIIPLGVWLAMKLVPLDVIEECRRDADEENPIDRRKGWAGAAIISLVWILIVFLVLRALWPSIHRRWHHLGAGGGRS